MTFSDGLVRRIAGLLLAASMILPCIPATAAEPLPEWTAGIREDHPRLFFNAETWPAVRQRALDQEKAWYASVRTRVDRWLPHARGAGRIEPADLGSAAAEAAFVYRMTGDRRYLDLARQCLDASLRYYDQCFAERKSVNWYSTSRVHATLAWDWLYNDLTPSERESTMSRLVEAIDRVLKARPPIYRENMSGSNTGFYGVRNCLWFIGCTAFGTGIQTERVNEWLVWGYDENLKMLAHRAKACGDAGGGASPTLGYVFGAYPWAEQNFFYTWLSSTGENIAPDWPQDTYCLFTCGGILRQHRHYDALNFVIYHRGHLALDSGTRYLEFDNGQHLANYFAQTVAHNCVVIHQPGEPPPRYWGGTVEGNHGGQHQQLGSVVKAFEVSDDFVYVAGDATACYQHGGIRREGQPDLPEKCTLVTRQLVFLPPDRFLVFDRVETTAAEYQKDWLLHTAHEPTVDGMSFRADHGQGRLLCRTLLPADARLSSVGGPGKEFWAAGKNWEIVDRGLKPEEKAMMGQWRVEVSPGTPRREDCFLHVIQVGDQRLEKMEPAELVERGTYRGVRLMHRGRPVTVTFAASGELDMRWE